MSQLNSVVLEGVITEKKLFSISSTMIEVHIKNEKLYPSVKCILDNTDRRWEMINNWLESDLVRVTGQLAIISIGLPDGGLKVVHYISGDNIENITLEMKG